MFSLICAWVNNREAGDFRRHGGHYDVIVTNFYDSRLYIFPPRDEPWKSFAIFCFFGLGLYENDPILQSILQNVNQALQT